MSNRTRIRIDMELEYKLDSTLLLKKKKQARKVTGVHKILDRSNPIKTRILLN